MPRTTIGLGFFEFEWRKHRLSALHQTLGEPVGVGNAAELYTNLVPSLTNGLTLHRFDNATLLPGALHQARRVAGGK